MVQDLPEQAPYEHPVMSTRKTSAKMQRSKLIDFTKSRAPTSGRPTCPTTTTRNQNRTTTSSSPLSSFSPLPTTTAPTAQSFSQESNHDFPVQSSYRNSRWSENECRPRAMNRAFLDNMADVGRGSQHPSTTSQQRNLLDSECPKKESPKSRFPHKDSRLVRSLAHSPNTVKTIRVPSFRSLDEGWLQRHQCEKDNNVAEGRSDDKQKSPERIQFQMKVSPRQERLQRASTMTRDELALALTRPRRCLNGDQHKTKNKSTSVLDTVLRSSPQIPRTIVTNTHQSFRHKALSKKSTNKPRSQSIP